MPVYVPQNIMGGITGVRGTEPGPRAKRPQYFYDTMGRGVPRFEDLLLMRVLENTHTVSLPMNTILTQISTTPIIVRPTVKNPHSSHLRACEEATEWFNGRFNRNRQSWDNIVKTFARDILSVDAGILELVPEEDDGFLSEMYARDGATFTKNPDIHGILPSPKPDNEPAYYQFSVTGAMGVRMYGSEGLPKFTDLMEGLYAEMAMRFAYGRREPVQFTQDQMVWMEERPRSWSVYGFGRVQSVSRVVELLLNQDLVNKKYFTSNEIPEGIINIANADKAGIDAFREYWNEEIKGQHHKVAIVNGDARWIGFRQLLKDLQFLESQRWYNLLTWMCFGLNANEVGDVGDVNRSTAEEQSLTVYRKTTMPLLALIANYMTVQVLPFMEAYQRIGGEMEFAFETTNPEIERMTRERQREDIVAGVATVNEVRLLRGEEILPWGDWPNSLVDSLSRNQPEWFLENVMGVEDVPSPSFPMYFSHGERDAEKTSLLPPHKSEQKKKDDNPDDSLRDEPAHPYPPIVQHIQRLERYLRDLIEGELETIYPSIRESWPNEDRRVSKAPVFNIIRILEQISLTGPMLRAINAANQDALGDSMVWYQNRLEADIKERLGEDYEPLSLIRVEDTGAIDRMRAAAAEHIVGVEDEIKEQVRQVLVDVQERGGNVEEAITALKQRVPVISENRARTIARTEILSASRESSQALGDSTKLVTGKSWHSTHDTRTRPWHLAMDKTSVPKDQDFIVPQLGAKGQPRDYPRRTYIVGGDQPYNCRCDQRPELREDMPTEPRALMAQYPEIKVVTLTEKMKLVLGEHGEPDETLRQLLRRTDSAHSKNNGAKILGVSKQTYYQWHSLFMTQHKIY